jgi:hypothetical protein
MMKASINLDVAGKGRVDCLASGSDPVQDSTFEALRVIRPCAVGTFLDLKKIQTVSDVQADGMKRD